MDVEEFRVRGKEMIDYICEYVSSIDSRRVTPEVRPGYLSEMLPGKAPQEPESWEDIMEDVERSIMPGITHWQHPGFHAYFPSGNSFPSMLGDMLSDAIGCIGFSWAASPACTELETIVLDWFGKAIGLPIDFLSSTSDTEGGGVIQSSASECILITMLAARNQAIKHLKNDPGHDDSLYLPKLVAYCSNEAHSCVEKAAMILLVKLRIIDVDDNGSLCAEALEDAMNKDELSGLFPFYVATTLGTTSSCSFDNLEEIGVICKSKPCVWLHVDGAYAGNAFICPELRYLLTGIEYADSFNTNTNKWLLVNFDCSCLWVRDRRKLTEALTVDPLYLQHKNASDAIDYRHWGIPLSRRFRSLKLWFVLRTYGISGLQAYIRNHIKLANVFESLVRTDDRFEVMNVVRLGLVCFRLVGSDAINRQLLANINASGEIHIIPSIVKGKYTIRFCVVSEKAKMADIHYAWKVIVRHTDKLKKTYELFTAPERNVSSKVKEECRTYFRSISQELGDHRTKVSPGIISA